MVSQSKILFTGGSGLLGGEVKKFLPKASYPSSKVFNVTNFRQMEKFLAKKRPRLIIHAAAYTSPPLAEKEPEKAIAVNIIGTANLARLCLKFGIKLVYISTDYVFKGDRGNYKEIDPMLPVNNYAWSKLGGECTVRMLPDFLIIHTSFGEKIFPYEKAFTNHYTSRESVDIIAKKIIKVVNSGLSGVIHLGHRRRSVYNYARSLKGSKKVGKLSIKDVKFVVPYDTSLNTGKFQKLFSRKK